jgi:cytochrome c
MAKLNNIVATLALLTGVVAFSACKKEEGTVTPDPAPAAEGTAPAAEGTAPAAEGAAPAAEGAAPAAEAPKA